jgi:hypothetical protein
MLACKFAGRYSQQSEQKKKSSTYSNSCNHATVHSLCLQSKGITFMDKSEVSRLTSFSRILCSPQILRELLRGFQHQFSHILILSSCLPTRFSIYAMINPHFSQTRAALNVSFQSVSIFDLWFPSSIRTHFLLVSRPL